MDDADRPRHFNLLSDAEIAGLRPLLDVLGVERDTVLARWHELYLDHFGDARALAKPAFLDLYGRDLDALVKNLLSSDMEGFDADVSAVGYQLVDRGVPFAEVIASLHLFEQSASAAFHASVGEDAATAAAYVTFDKVSHCRIILLASAYFQGYRGDAAVRTRGLEQEAERLGGVTGARTRFHGLVGASTVMQRLYEQIATAAGGKGAVLIVGESGTGKELVARALHERAGSPERPFVAVNCAALPRELMESELFGHRRGAYTGAQAEYAGLVRSASGGTLFLDEITEMTPSMQAKLLRVLEEHVVRAVGAPREVPVNVRFIASTNRSPEKAVEADLLRRDLYYRLNVHRLDLPPLRQRLEDVPLLATHFAELLAGRGLRKVEGFAEDALGVLQGYAWPGNVRELRNAVEHALTLVAGARVRASELPTHVVRGARPGAAPSESRPGEIPTLQAAELDLIRQALEATGGNKVRAAKLLRISRHRLYDKLRKLGTTG